MKKLQRWLLLGAAALLYFSVSITGLAAQIGTVTASSINVRAEADASAEWVCSLTEGATVNVVDSAQDSSGNTWYSVTFDLNGTETSGWIRSDLLSVTDVAEESEDPDTPEGSEEPDMTGGAVGNYQIEEPTEAYSGADSFNQTTVTVGDQEFSAYQPEDSSLYLVWARDASGTAGWYWYDASEGMLQRDLGQFGQAGLVTALQSELTEAKEKNADALSKRLYLIIGLGVLSAILLIVVIVLALKLRNAEYEYYEEDEEPDEEPSVEEEPRTEKRTRRRRQEEEDDEFEDFLKAVEERRGRDLDEIAEESAEETGDVFDTSMLPKIDMSAVEDIEEEAQAAEHAKEAEDPEDFDIEILDFDDLDI